MPKLPELSGAEMIRRLKKLGFEVVRQRGSHVVLKKHGTSIGCVVPLRKSLRKGTVYGILRLAQVTHDLFESIG
jgi:predicted RNA binding protein YcfA (HicA-like mRNA interferase family)